MKPPQPSPPPQTENATILDRNISALIERRREQERQKTFQEKMSDAVTRFAGSLPFVYVHAGIVILWVLINLGATPLPKFDPTFVILATVASVEAIFLSTFVLITQNRQAALADERANLDLQVSLLAEHEITRLITLLSAIGKKLDVQEASDPTLTPLKEDVAPQHVLERMNAAEKQ
ncbi:MAG: DUF1003 domain-containing protein [Nibricoccus sp.]